MCLGDMDYPIMPETVPNFCGPAPKQIPTVRDTPNFCGPIDPEDIATGAQPEGGPYCPFYGMIMAYARERGLGKPQIRFDKDTGWELSGFGMDNQKKKLLAWAVAEELGISHGCGNGGESFGVQQIHPENAKMPGQIKCANHSLIINYCHKQGVAAAIFHTPAHGWTLRGGAGGAGDSVAEVAEQLGIAVGTAFGDGNGMILQKITPELAKLPKGREPLSADEILSQLAVLMEVMPEVLDSLEGYTLESLLPYARRLLLAATVFHSVERRLDESWRSDHPEDAEQIDAEEGEDDGPNYTSPDLFDDDAAMSEEEKSRAIAELSHLTDNQELYCGD